MNGSDLRRQIEIELERLARAVEELHIIQLRLTEDPDAVIEKTAAGALLAQFYAGVERILKRIALYHGVNPSFG